MERMVFNTREEMKSYISNKFVYLGDGSQGTCFADYKNGLVYKVFNDYLDDELFYFDDVPIVSYSESEIMKFSIDSDLCIFPIGLIMIGDIVCGYMCKYVSAKNLFKIDPLRVNLNSISTSYERAKNDIKKLSDNKVLFYDIMYNILYNGSKKRFYIVDPMDFSSSCADASLLYDVNLQRFNVEIKRFLIDGYFCDFVSCYCDLFSMYNDDNVDVISFINLFRTYVYEVTGKEITFLGEIRELMDKEYVSGNYIRELKKYR